MRKHASVIPVIMMVVVFFIVGCSRGATTTLTSSASFDRKANVGLKGTVLPDGLFDKIVLIEGTVTSPFMVTVGVSQSRDATSSSESAEIHFEINDGKLSPLGDWQMAGGGERPALRRENDDELSVYYPTELKGKRNWVKFKINLRK